VWMPAPQKSPSPLEAPKARASATPDAEYLNGDDPALALQWSRSGEGPRDLPAMKDDFVQVPLPRLAASRAGRARSTR